MIQYAAIGAAAIGYGVSASLKKQYLTDTPWETVSGKMKALIWFTALLNPIFGGIMMYYMMHKQLPTIAKKANRITFIAFGIHIILSVLYFWVLLPQA